MLERQHWEENMAFRCLNESLKKFHIYPQSQYYLSKVIDYLELLFVKSSVLSIVFLSIMKYFFPVYRSTKLIYHRKSPTDMAGKLFVENCFLTTASKSKWIRGSNKTISGRFAWPLGAVDKWGSVLDIGGG